MKLRRSRGTIAHGTVSLAALLVVVVGAVEQTTARAHTGFRRHGGHSGSMLGELSTRGRGSVASSQDLEYIGSRECRSCHLREYATWARTAHARVFELLEPGARPDEKRAAGLEPDNDYTADPVCLECHTVGFEQPGGFENAAASKDLMGVGCEACHGPGSEYSPEAVMGLRNRNHSFESVIAKGLIYPVPAEVCQRCHNERSPFNVTVDAKYAFEYTRELVEQASHDHPRLIYDHGPLPPGVMFQPGYAH